MPWDEFCALVAGLMPDTPLGATVSIRAEKDPKTIKSFSPEQRRIHRDWRMRQANTKLGDPEQLQKDMDNMRQMFSAMFGRREAGR